MKIAGHEVSAITNQSAKIGCASVSRTEVEALLEEMKKVPAIPEYQIRACMDLRNKPSSTHVLVKMDTEETGFFAVNQDRQTTLDFYPNGSFANKTLWLCLRPEMAKDLIAALQEGLANMKAAQKR